MARLGLTVVCANNGLDVVETWTSHPPGHFDTTFIDHHMLKCSSNFIVISKYRYLKWNLAVITVLAHRK
ncbi:hypothetical protein BJV82DRAFT_673277 [Fennellomyces sp. T-0311]|nr:hypothetical protein BJV82DRAFT_673277 [Fennellomyces sp. T-0311]